MDYTAYGIIFEGNSRKGRGEVLLWFWYNRRMTAHADTRRPMEQQIQYITAMVKLNFLIGEIFITIGVEITGTETRP